MCCFQIQEITVPTDFASIVRAPSSGRTTAVLLDHRQYAQAVLLRGQPIPWTDAVQYAQFLKQAQGLLRPDSTLLDLGVWYAQALAADPVLQSAMAARSRRGFARRGTWRRSPPHRRPGRPTPACRCVCASHTVLAR